MMATASWRSVATGLQRLVRRPRVANTNIGVSRPSSSVAQQHVFTSQEPMIECSPGNFTTNLLKNSHRWQDKVALECSVSGATVTYAQLKDQMARWGGFLLKKGFRKGDVVAIVGPNINEFPIVAFGTTAVGGVVTGINPTYTPDEMAFQLKDSNAQMVVVFSPLVAVVRAALSIIKKDLPILTMGGPSAGDVPTVNEILQDDSIPFADPLEVAGDDPLALMYSSGTTGTPKGAILTHGGVYASVSMITHPTFMPDQETTEEFQHRYLQLLPMFHSGGLLGVLIVGLKAGAKMINYPKFDPKNFVQVLQKYKITDLPIVPAIVNFMAAFPGCDAASLQHLQVVLCGTAPLSTTMLEVLLQKIGRPIVFQQAYGMTELLFATIDPAGALKSGYAGRLLPGVQAKVLDLSSGETLPANMDGEICIKSPSQMTGYLNMPEATRQTIDAEGWLHTGDVGQFDEEGYLKIVDRTKDLIKVKGFQVSPSELEDVILQIPGVVEAAVVGVPHDRHGEAPRAYVVAKSVMEEAVVTEHVSKMLSKTKQLTGGVVFVSSLPRTSTGKVLKRDLQVLAREGK